MCEVGRGLGVLVGGLGGLWGGLSECGVGTEGVGGVWKACFGFSPKLNYRGTKGLL